VRVETSAKYNHSCRNQSPSRFNDLVDGAEGIASGRLAVEPGIEGRETEPPQLTHLHTTDFAPSRQALQRFWMDLKQSGSLVRIKEWLE
jgi:hypothetical protein